MIFSKDTKPEEEVEEKKPIVVIEDPEATGRTVGRL